MRITRHNIGLWGLKRPASAPNRRESLDRPSVPPSARLSPKQHLRSSPPARRRRVSGASHRSTRPTQLAPLFQYSRMETVPEEGIVKAGSLSIEAASAWAVPARSRHCLSDDISSSPERSAAATRSIGRQDSPRARSAGLASPFPVRAGRSVASLQRKPKSRAERLEQMARKATLAWRRSGLRSPRVRAVLIARRMARRADVARSCRVTDRHRGDGGRRGRATRGRRALRLRLFHRRDLELTWRRPSARRCSIGAARAPPEQ